MCGLVGIFDLRGQRPVDAARLARMNDRQRHRGPDGEGAHLEPGVGLAHRRLAIIDVASGQQPLANEDGSVVIVFNGEIYNYQALIPELLALGHVFRTRSDTEVIVHAWEAWGERCVERLRGMFAFAIWDRNRQVLFLARDRLGVKPLFVGETTDGWLLFGSELKALRAAGGMDEAIDPLAIEEYLALGYVAEPRTIFQSCRKLPPAHHQTVARGAAPGAPREYWDVRFAPVARLDPVEAGEELVRRLRESVRLRLMSEVPLGAFLSGGVDSSAVVAAMAMESGVPVTTCSIAFDDPAYDESAYAEAVARRWGTRHTVDLVTGDDLSLVDRLVDVYDEPFADSSALPTYRVCALARRHVTVALSGDGGDESLAGYQRYRRGLREVARAARVPAVARRLLAGLAGALPRLGAEGSFVARGRFALERFGLSPLAFYATQMAFVPAGTRAPLYSAALRRELDGYSALTVLERHAARAGTDDPLALMQYVDLKTYLVGDINTKVDRASMAHGLEVREPLMDHALVEWLATLPGALKVRGDEGKWLLKRALEPHLPHDVLYRPKRGFAVPLARWFRGPLAARAQALATSERLQATGWFDGRVVARLAAAHASGRADHATTLWTLLMLERFLATLG